MLIFGAQINAKDPRFFGFREQIRLKNPRNDHIAPKLGRSGKMFQLCFNLKGVGLLTNNSGDDAEPSDGSIRTVSIYHRFDVEHGTSLWIVTKGGRDLLDRYKEITGPDAPEDARCFSDAAACFRASLSVHLMFCHWSTEDWQGYISWLENHLDYRSDLAYHYSQVESTYELGDIADLQYWRDNANQAVLLLNANIEILNSLRKFYVNLTNRADFPTSLKADCEHDLEVFLSQLDEIMKDLQRQLERARLIINIVNDRKELVLQHLQAQTEQLNRNMGREAAVMRIITIVTLLYLPSTFVSQ
ncbi:uncharacterized protein J4E87_005361 [Alternaria ethzedia]|uniref:uncharacterized protein n=1 Tax=Alternaria ethzedia TaxID=181014 RepID=UPI0020C28179|nr:uncharacterized protein J4E87_005361 [Alternaria ethzedia]KAI4624880.1 hypothetical protein J4E87_005361 [Alternaria ethzedia]